MRTISLFLLAVLAATSLHAAWYQQTDGTIVDPILDIGVGIHSYSGNNLEPSADLTGAWLPGANLSYANLTNADLTGAWLPGANLYGAQLPGANLSYANLTNADLTGAQLPGANLSYANLSRSILTGVQFSETTNWTDAFYYHSDSEPTWDSGMDAAWRSSVGITVVGLAGPLPEPGALLLALLGLALLPRRRRR